MGPAQPSSQCGLRKPCSRGFSFLCALLLGLGRCVAPAQPNPEPAIPANQLMQLMRSQLPVDINSPVTVEAVLDPPVIGVGDKAVYRIRLNALEASIRWSQQIPVPPGLQITPSAQAQVLQPMGPMLRPLTAMNFHVRATRPGLYTLPAFVLEVYGKPVVVREAHLEVAPKLEPDEERARELVLVPARTNVFVGETLRVRVFAPGVISNVVENLMQMQFNGEGFLGDKNILSQSVEPLEFNGRKWPSRVQESSVTPIAVGQQQLSVQSFTLGWQPVGPVGPNGQTALRLTSPMQYLLLDSEPVTLNVRPLPPEGAVQGFTGFIGKLLVEPPHLSTNSLRVGDAIRLLVTFQGVDRLTRFTPPPPPRVLGWQIFPAMPAEPPPSRIPVASPRVAFAYTMMPMSEEVRLTPAIPFSVFDPEQAVYRDLTIPGVTVTVSAEGLPVDWKPASWASESRPEQKPSLSALTDSPGKRVPSLVPLQLRASFIGLQLAPALVLFVLWRWDQRRRFLEAHPEVVRRREARRALRREKRALRRAASQGDAPGFAARAVAALRIAAAPHFPAEPRALVCGEVLSLFNDQERSGKTGEVIRSVFVRDESVSYAPRPEQQMPLFALQPELEGILKQMEARL